MKCRICSSAHPTQFLSLGNTPLANSFLSKEKLGKPEGHFPLDLYFCSECSLVQLGHVVSPETLFSNYLYVTSTSKTFRDHFTSLSKDITHTLNLKKGSLVIDIGSNDGLLLKGFQHLGMKVLGIEPAANIAKIANNAGIETLNTFFDEATVQHIILKHGKADVITATNVFAHIPDINTVTANVKNLLSDSGVFVIEVQYVVDTIETMTFDNVYHEHLYYYSLTSLKHLFESHGMTIFDVKHVDSHGGSLRVFVSAASSRKASNSVLSMLERERKMGVSTISPYEQFAIEVNTAKESLIQEIKSLKKQGKSIAGYGAPAKSTTLLNFCGITNKDIDYIVEDNPLKIGLYAPGTHIPIVPSSALLDTVPDYLLILAWNFSAEIMEKTKELHSKGTKCIIPLPKPRIV
jgi:SAM-dependent methyltransferase